MLGEFSGLCQSLATPGKVKAAKLRAVLGITREEEEWVSESRAGVHTCPVGSTFCIPAAACEDGVRHDQTPRGTCTEKRRL